MNKYIKKYLFWVKKVMIGKRCLPLNNDDIIFAILFGTIYLPFTIVVFLIKKIIQFIKNLFKRKPPEDLRDWWTYGKGRKYHDN